MRIMWVCFAKGDRAAGPAHPRILPSVAFGRGRGRLLGERRGPLLPPAADFVRRVPAFVQGAATTGTDPVLGAHASHRCALPEAFDGPFSRAPAEGGRPC